ncbi:unnamed protein product [Rotaria sp. Silwood2]|nr:unnamed protein product [Rotaria sp. Silwood2]CAF3523781.1 unnamed protein product [Rotaria sp. Silwood2]CAF4630675.1 unnamed protein product [Rotaria sp. Silwood2]
MPSGVHFSVDMKKLIFRVIKFVENEKTGPSIPLYNCNARLVAMLGISEGALLKLKKELTAAQNAEEQEYRPPRLRSQSKVRPVSKLKRRSSSLGLSSASIVVPEPEPTKKRSGRVPIKLSEQADSEIRFQFHALLAENIYPNTDNLLERLHQLHNDFPVQSKTTLRRHLHRIGFSYKSTTKVKIPLDNICFVAQRAKFFRKMDELRDANALVFFHDESWINSGTEKTSIWVDNDGKGRIKKNEGKGNSFNLILELKTKCDVLGSRIAISAMMNIDGIHLPTVDIFTCSKDHSVNSEYFLKWIETAAFRLRTDNGPQRRICIVIDNAPWHCELVDSCKPVKRSWKKDKIKQWLNNRSIHFDPLWSKAELLEIASVNRPMKRYKVNEIAMEFNVEIVRLPVRHCCLNPIELCWANLKEYVRKGNTRFQLTDVRELAAQFIASYDGDTATKVIKRTQEIENKFKIADRHMEENIEPMLDDEESSEESDVVSSDDE